MFTKITSRTYALPELEGIQYERTITDSINSQDSQDKINSNINGEMNIMTSVNVEIIESNKPEEFNKINLFQNQVIQLLMMIKLLLH